MYVHILLFLFSKVFYGKIYAPKCVRWENNEEGSNIIMMRPLHAHTAVLFRFFLSKYIIMDFGKDSSTDKTFVRYHELRTPNPSIYLHLIFAILQFEILSLMNWIFCLYSLKWIFLPIIACKIKVWNGLKIKFIKLDTSNWRIAKIKCR